MNSREQVLTVLNHEQPDRVPIILGASNATGLKMKPYRGLRSLLGIEEEERYLYDWPELGTALPGEAMLQRLHSDVRGVHDRLPQAVNQRNRTRIPHSPYIDDWGSGSKEIEPGVWYPGVHPMAEAHTIAEIEAYPWPDMDDPYRVAQVRAAAQSLAEQNEYAILATPWLLFPFERAFAMQGMDRFMENLALYPDFAQALLEKHASLCKTLMGHFLEALGDNVDMIKIGDDLGSQERLLISPRMYRRLLKPIHADYISFIKQHTKAKVFFHTDGDVFDLVEDFIEIGVDILNPIQTSAGRMSDLAELKKRFGSRLVFCGAIDTQRLLPYGTPQEVRAEVRRVIEILAPGGGYMLGAVHTIMDEVPPENILAMVDAVAEFEFAHGAALKAALKQDMNTPSSWQEALFAAVSVRRALLDADQEAALRLFNGFSEGCPHLTADLYGGTLLLQSYGESEEPAASRLAEAQALLLQEIPAIRCVVQKARLADQPNAGPTHEAQPGAAMPRRGRVTFGSPPDDRIVEHGVAYAIDLLLNQDASFYLDTRRLRAWLLEHAAGWRVLNTFAYTGSLGVAALAGGAAYVAQVDLNRSFLELAQRSALLNRLDEGKMRLYAANFFNQVAAFKRSGALFDCVILDPPYFSTTRQGVVDLEDQSARLINKVRPLVKDSGRLVAINNALFASGAQFMQTLQGLCADGYLEIEALLPVPEDCTGFPETIRAAPPVDPAPFNHPSKIAVLRVRRKVA